MTVGTQVNLVGSAQMSAMLAGLPNDVRREVRPAIRTAGEIVAAAARANASWSSRIPGAIRVRTSFAGSRAGATVVVDAAKAPHARAYEGITTRGDSFRHPVYGGDTWVTQRTRPFLIPAGRAKEMQAARMVEQAVNAATARAVK